MSKSALSKRVRLGIAAFILLLGAVLVWLFQMTSWTEWVRVLAVSLGLAWLAVRAELEGAEQAELKTRLKQWKEEADDLDARNGKIG